ncbi:MAG TPA: ParB/RepB/Spo0J family partition protein [Pirellulales bacterium]|jgi:ParB family chromosome partitioning protein|nr:ParB/RepB/Spo0J family partition protein [Pirellulales bacterium]
MTATIKKHSKTSVSAARRAPYSPLAPLADRLEQLPIQSIDPHPDNVRDDDQAGIDEMIPSIQQSGIVQPIVVRQSRGGRFQIVAGERRWRAARAAGESTIPAIVRVLNDADTLVQMLIENLQRRDLNAIQTARMLERLCQPLEAGGAGKSLTDTAAIFGRSDSWARNLIRLLRLPDEWQQRLIRGELTERQGRALLAHVDSPAVLAAIAADMVNNPWAWATSESFERSVAIIAAQRIKGGTAAAAPPRPPRTSPAASPTAAASIGEETERVKEHVAPIDEDTQGVKEHLAPPAAESLPGEVPPAAAVPMAPLAAIDQICELLENIESASDLNRIQSAVNRRRQELAAARTAQAAGA